MKLLKRANFGELVDKPLRILDFDTECRPMHYSEWRPESQITAYAWSWVGQKTVHSLMLRHHDDEREFFEEERDLLFRFLVEFERADIVTGHYLLKHDLPLLTDHAMRLGLPLPAPVMVSDTKIDMPRIRALGMSQENLGDLLRIDEKKHHMSGRLWAEANQLTNQGIAISRKRVTDDVKQHKAIFRESRDRGWLSAPSYWKP